MRLCVLVRNRLRRPRPALLAPARRSTSPLLPAPTRALRVGRGVSPAPPAASRRSAASAGGKGSRRLRRPNTRYSVSDAAPSGRRDPRGGGRGSFGKGRAGSFGKGRRGVAQALARGGSFGDLKGQTPVVVLISGSMELGTVSPVSAKENGRHIPLNRASGGG